MNEEEGREDVVGKRVVFSYLASSFIQYKYLFLLYYYNIKY